MTAPLPQRLMLRNGIFYFRICVPRDVVEAIGKRVVIRSLRTKDVRVARSQLPYLIVAAENEFESLRKKCARAEAIVTPVENRHAFDPQAAIAAAPAISNRFALTSLLPNRERSPGAAKSTVSAHRVEANISQQSTKPVVELRPSGLASNTLSIDVLFEKWERETNPSASTLSTWGGHKRHFSDFMGEKASNLQSITDRDIVAWKDRLVDEGRSPATISRSYLGFAHALFRYAVANRLLPADPSARVKLAGKAKAGTRMLGYSGHEVAALLSHASAAKVAWKRWLPWLAASTGARVGEIAQLHACHVGKENGIAFIRITPAPDAGSIKNEGSERTVPIHKSVLTQGFLEFVESRGSGPLFYEKTSGDPKKKHASKSVTNRLAAWIRELGFKDERKAPNHALRHWFKSECARLKIADSVVDAIQGHVDTASATIYRHISLEMMADAINTLTLTSALTLTSDSQSLQDDKGASSGTANGPGTSSKS